MLLFCIVDAIVQSIVHIVMHCCCIFVNIVANIVLLLNLLLLCYEYCCTVNCYIVMVIVAFILHCYCLLLHCYCCIVIVYCCIVIVALLLLHCFCCIVIVNLQYCSLLLQYCGSGSSQMTSSCAGSDSYGWVDALALPPAAFAIVEALCCTLSQCMAYPLQMTQIIPFVESFAYSAW